MLHAYGVLLHILLRYPDTCLSSLITLLHPLEPTTSVTSTLHLGRALACITLCIPISVSVTTRNYVAFSFVDGCSTKEGHGTFDVQGNDCLPAKPLCMQAAHT